MEELCVEELCCGRIVALPSATPVGSWPEVVRFGSEVVRFGSEVVKYVIKMFSSRN